MKKILSLILLSPALLFGAATTDIKPGLDPTGLSSITGAQLYQMVQGSVIATNKGAIVFGASTPDVANNVRFKTWIWLDSSTLPPSIKVYNTNTSAWVAQPVTAGAIGTNEITANAVYSTNIVNEEVSAADIASQSLISRHFFDNQISNAFMAVRTLEGGYLGSIGLATITHTNIALGTIQGGNLASGTVTSNYIGESTIYAYHIAATNVTADELRTDAVTTDKLTNSAVTTAKIADTNITYGKLDTNVSHTLPVVWASVGSGGTVLKGHGVSAILQSGTGRYRITFASALSSTNYAVLATSLRLPNTGNAISYYSNQTDSVWVNIDGTGSAQQTDPFSIVIYDY
jgi:hypothetical protein